MGRAGASRGAASPLASIDPALHQQQILIASLPDQPPEVHIACLYPQQAVLSLREASVGGNSQVALGGERNVSLVGAASVEASDRVVSVLEKDGRPRVQLHFETAEDERKWAHGLRAVLASQAGGKRSGPPTPSAGAAGAHGAIPDEAGSASDELPALQARSHELQSKISGLEAVSDRRDKQLQKMMQRLDGAMQMLSAVQEMCQQQRKVVYSQRVAIVELRKDLGENPGMDPDGDDGEAEDEAEDEGASEGDDGDDRAEASGGPEMAEKAEKMLSLLQQADEMQRMLQKLEASAGAGGDDDADDDEEEDDEDDDQDGGGAAGEIGSAGDAARMLQQLLGSLGGGMEDDPEAQDAISALGRLRQLEEEKEKFEGMLEAKKREHDQMLTRHNDMKAMMAALGVRDNAQDDSDGDA